MEDLVWSCKPFYKLSHDELYAILKLRSEVFIVEQECPYQDPDDNDQAALHVLGERDGKLFAYSRLLPPGVKYDASSIGRVITSQEIRRDGFGKLLMEKSIAYCGAHWPNQGITISAQQYLESFYHGLNFQTESDAYLEDDIPHIRMHLPPPTSN